MKEEEPAGGADSWSAAAVSGRLAWYVKPSYTRTFEASGEMVITVMPDRGRGWGWPVRARHA